MFLLLPGALLLTAFAPWLIVPILMIGGSYLAFEAAEALSAEYRLAKNGSANRRAKRWNSIRILHLLSNPLAETRAAAAIPNWRQAT